MTALSWAVGSERWAEGRALDGEAGPDSVYRALHAAHC